ncbi:phospholipid carrier-dependent glycosyltransferase [Candidatus Saccharibacteria bacterium]|nr:phospholipid carrier-dependent glycosyltransferase [Candidatus Saccharibacteria bacterium]
MKFFRRVHPELILLTLAAFITRFWFVTKPNAVVFDEVYFKVYAGDYLTHSYYFDPHPPLGKELLGLWAWLSHQSGAILTSSAPGVDLRYLPAFAGALIIPVVYVLLRQLGGSRRIATLAALAVLADNALLVESRLVLIDSMLVLFGLGAVVAYLASRTRTGWRSYTFVALAAILGGMASSTKWTGISALGLIGLIWLYDLVKKHANLKQAAIRLAMIITIPTAVYLTVFAIHFATLTNSGQGDAFMPLRFQATLVGNPNYSPTAHESFIHKFIDLNVEMNAAEASLKTATHPYGSAWYTWPIESRPVYYWAGDALPNGNQGNIYLLGNPVVWWGTLIVLAVLGGQFLAGRRIPRRWVFAIGLLSTAYLANWLPFSLIHRVMFLYHYLFALIYSIALASLGLGLVSGWNLTSDHFWHFRSKASRNGYIAALVLIVVGFVYFIPLSYGNPISPSSLVQHDWLKSWR